MKSFGIILNTILIAILAIGASLGAILVVYGATTISDAHAQSGSVNAQKAVADAKTMVQGYSGRNDGRYNNIRSETLILETGSTVTYFENGSDRCYISVTGSISCTNGRR